jgi:hypothetical protein
MAGYRAEVEPPRLTRAAGGRAQIVGTLGSFGPCSADGVPPTMGQCGQPGPVMRGPGRGWPPGTSRGGAVDDATAQGAVRLIEAAALGQLFTSLHGAGYRIIGPTVRDGAIVLD